MEGSRNTVELVGIYLSEWECGMTFGSSHGLEMPKAAKLLGLNRHALTPQSSLRPHTAYMNSGA